MVQPRKAPIRFRERVELLDFLLEVSRITSETLDLDKLLENVASIVKEVVPYDLFAILLWTERSQGLSIRYAIGHRQAANHVASASPPSPERSRRLTRRPQARPRSGS